MAIRKITVIGAGSVGSATAFALAIRGIAHEIVLVDINEERARGEAMDIFQGTPLFDDPVDIHAGNYEDAAGSNLVVITSGQARKPGQTRIDLVKTNANIIKEVTPKIVRTCPDAMYVIVANPVDILTYVFHKISGVPANKIVGSGTLLDTARLRSRISEYLSVSQKNVHAYVFGEHGDTSFVPWSIAEISTVRLTDCEGMIHLSHENAMKLDYDEIEDYIRSSGAQIIKAKGHTNYAIAMAVCGLCECLFSGANSIVTASTMLNGDYGISDVCLSLPVLLGKESVQGHITPVLTPPELIKLRNSAAALRQVIDQLDI